MSRTRRTLLLAAVATLVGGCRPDRVGAPGDTAGSVSLSEAARSFMDDQTPVRSRWDAPWWRMSDTELATHVDAAGGRVFIGFKEPGKRAGVDNSGRVDVSTSTRNSAKEWLESTGVALKREFEMIPAVVVEIDGSDVARIRANPLVDYVEPIFPGVRLQQATPWNVQHVRAPESWASSTGGGVNW